LYLIKQKRPYCDVFIAVVAHSLVVGVPDGERVTGRVADVMLAAYHASEAALRLVKPGNEAEKVTDAVQKIAEDYKCKPIEGMLSHQLNQDVIDGEKNNYSKSNRRTKKRA